MATSNINLDLSWQNGFKGTGQITGRDFNVGISIPANLGGSGEGANPKELLVSSASACFIATLSAILDGNKLPVEQLQVGTQAEASDDGLAIRHNVSLKLSANATDAQLEKVHGLVSKADNVCAVGNILRKSGATIEAAITSLKKEI